MGDYGIGDLINAASSAGFKGPSLITAVAISLAEDGRMQLQAVGTNSDGSRDRGPWQINNKWHPEVSDACAFDLNCAAQAAYRISNQGASFTPWATFNNGDYKQHLSDATAGASSPTISTLSNSSSSSPSVIDLSGIGTAINAVTSNLISTAQIAGGALLIAFGLTVAVVMLVLKNA